MTGDPSPVLEPHEVRDGARVLRFEGWLLALGTSRRPGAPRWSEILIYRLIADGYVISKIGRSTMAHRPDCSRVTSRMSSWIDARDRSEAEVHRTPCPECRPVVGDRMDPQTRLEPTRYRAIYAVDAESVVDTLLEGRPREALPLLVETVLRQSAQVDDDLGKCWAELLPRQEY